MKNCPERRRKSRPDGRQRFSPVPASRVYDPASLSRLLQAADVVRVLSRARAYLISPCHRSTLKDRRTGTFSESLLKLNASAARRVSRARGRVVASCATSIRLILIASRFQLSTGDDRRGSAVYLRPGEPLFIFKTQNPIEGAAQRRGGIPAIQVARNSLARILKATSKRTSADSSAPDTR